MTQLTQYSKLYEYVVDYFNRSIYTGKIINEKMHFQSGRVTFSSVKATLVFFLLKVQSINLQVKDGL